MCSCVPLCVVCSVFVVCTVCVVCKMFVVCTVVLCMQLCVVCTDVGIVVLCVQLCVQLCCVYNCFFISLLPFSLLSAPPSQHNTHISNSLKIPQLPAT